MYLTDIVASTSINPIVKIKLEIVYHLAFAFGFWPWAPSDNLTMSPCALSKQMTFAEIVGNEMFISKGQFYQVHYEFCESAAT